MKLLHCSDIHVTAGHRWEETLRVLDEIVHCATREKVDLVALAGDVWHHNQPHRPPVPVEYEEVMRRLFHLQQLCPVIIPDGNHDVEDGNAVLNFAGDQVYTYERPELQSALLDWPIVVVPYPQKRFFTRAGAGLEAERQDAGGALASMIRGLVAPFRDAPKWPIVIGHFMVGGAQVGGGEKLIGREIEISPGQMDDLPVAYWALGHIHRPQQVSQRGWYCGTPTSHNRGEIHAKGFNLVEIEEGREPRVDYVPTSATLFGRATATWHEASGVWGELDVLTPDAQGVVEMSARARYVEGERPDFDQLQKSVALFADAGKVTIFPDMRPRERSAALEIPEGVTRAEECRLFWESMDNQPAEDVQAVALGLIDEISQG